MLAETRGDLAIASLKRAYDTGERTPADVLSNVLSRIASCERKNVWITRLTRAQIDAQLAEIEAKRKTGKPLPLYGIPFAVKDNINVVGVPTTAACPAFAYTPNTSATVVQRLCDAGAVIVGKTNLDQFATGLVGTRSPYGACENSVNPEYISGGSSSGSAVAVACGLISFSLGTDTAGSGRVPASFNNLIGLKPTRGLLSITGVVPACRSLDCVSIFATTCEDARTVLNIAAAEDPADALSRTSPPQTKAHGSHPWATLRIGIPRHAQLEFFGNTAAAELFQQAISRAKSLGATLTEIDYTPFQKVAALLYEGPFVVERLQAAGKLLAENPDALRPEIRTILEGSKRFSPLDVFEVQYQLAALRKQTEEQWKEMDTLLLPTAGTIYTIAEVEANPLALNKNLGFYTNFVNLLDLSALAVPVGFLPTSLPWGVTFITKPFEEAKLLSIGATFTAHSPTERRIA